MVVLRLDHMDDDGKLDSEKIYDIVVTTILVVGVAANIYIMLDEASGGQLTRDVKRMTDRQRENMRRYRALIRDRSRVLAHAEWAKREAVMDDETESEDE